jgi:hypothetical protein
MMEARGTCSPRAFANYNFMGIIMTISDSPMHKEADLTHNQLEIMNYYTVCTVSLSL